VDFLSCNSNYHDFEREALWIKHTDMAYSIKRPENVLDTVGCANYDLGVLILADEAVDPRVVLLKIGYGSPIASCLLRDLKQHYDCCVA
jgi:hypothetical protein